MPENARATRETRRDGARSAARSSNEVLALPASCLGVVGAASSPLSVAPSGAVPTVVAVTALLQATRKTVTETHGKRIAAP